MLEPTIRAAQQHVTAVDKYHLLPELPQAAVLAFAKAVERTPELASEPVESVVNTYEA